MVCKEDVITWFKEAASYRRIDVMCSLLNMCIPFELRYLGTCIEEQGKHDYQELRGAAITANNTEKLAKDFSNFKGLLDKCARHRLTIYLSLLQSRNYSCANWIYITLMRTESVDTYLANSNFNKDANLHTELLLLFTLALNHPAFTFEQKRYFGDAVSRLAEPEIPVQTMHNLPPCPPGLGYNIKPPLPVHPMPLVVPKPHSEAPMPPPGIPLPTVHGAEFGPGIWSRTHYINANCPPPDLTAFPPPISPLVSQQSSPTTSRTVSPTRMYPCRLFMYRPHPPPMSPMVHMERLPPQSVKDPILTTQYNTDLKTIPIEEVHSDTTTEKNLQHGWMEPMVLGNKLANGLIAGVPMSVPPPKCQTMYLSNEMQQLSIDGDASLRCTSSSASSNSSDCHSPPDTPTESVITPPHGPGRGLMPEPIPLPQSSHTTNKLRNGGNGNGIGTVPPPGLSAPIVSVTDLNSATIGSNPALYTSTCTVPYSTHYPVPPPPTTTFHNRSFLPIQSYRPQYPPYQQNGEIPFLYPYLCMYSSAAIPPPKITCYNCGRTGHIGSECKEPTIEEITQKKGYQLDYTSPPPDAPPSSEK